MWRHNFWSSVVLLPQASDIVSSIPNHDPYKKPCQREGTKVRPGQLPAHTNLQPSQLTDRIIE